MAYINGGTVGPFQSFPDGSILEGVTIVAPCTFGSGCVFIGCFFQCRTFCKGRPCGCCPDVSQVGEGSVTEGCSGDHVSFESSGTAASFSNRGCGSLTLPGCVDCGGTTTGASVEYTGTDVVVSSGGNLSADKWCKDCTGSGVVAYDDGSVEQS